jgi:putative phosphoribosyl transferase
MQNSEISIPIGRFQLNGELQIAPQVPLVIFAHGSGSGRHSPRNQFVAQVLRESGLGTLLFDLMTPEEEQAEAQTRHLRFNIDFLAGRLVNATRWALAQLANECESIGYFGASTGAAAALLAAVEIGDEVKAVVSRGGRPDLAGEALEHVQAPTLLLVGGADTQVIALNQMAHDRLRCEKDFKIIPGATHLFEEPEALPKVAAMAAAWFGRHLVAN